MIGTSGKWRPVGVLLALVICAEITSAKHRTPLDRYRHRRRSMGRRIHQQVEERSLSFDWEYEGCYQDSLDRLLPWEADSPYMSMPGCLAYCGNRGYSYAGVEGGNQCFCGNFVNGGSTVDEDRCHLLCGGGGGATCGGNWTMSLWHLGPITGTESSTSETGGTGLKYTVSTPTVISNTHDNPSNSTGSASSAAVASEASSPSSASPFASQPVSSPASSQAAASSATADAAASSSSVATSSGVSYQPQTNAPSSGANKFVWAHLIVGNTYPYTYDDWVNDVNLAAASGIDGFILNIGSDSWQPGRVADAYAAAQNHGFSMMLSFDMTALSCWSTDDAALVQTYVKKYVGHPAAAQISGKSAVTTFSGQECTFGQSDSSSGWAYALAGSLSQIYWMPSYNNDPTGLASSNIDAEVNWGSAWPTAAIDIDDSRDKYFMGLLQPASKKYVGTVSPLFFSHLSYKNFMWRGDDWLFAQRWEQLIAMRDQIDQVEIVSWNDFGESHYVGPIAGGLPEGTGSYVNDAFAHTDVLPLLNFYATAFKTGSYPAISKDQIWIMARPHPALASASDPLGPPDGHTFSTDNFYAQVHLTAAADVLLCSGSSCSTQSGGAGINRFSHPLTAGSGISVQIKRGGATAVSLNPDFTFDGSPSTYNYNYIIKSSG